MKKLYLAGPLFSAAEKSFNKYLKKVLSPYYDVYLPQEDGKLLVDLLKNGVEPRFAKKQIFNYDLEAIQRCDVLLIILDGRTIDEGASFELGCAYILGKECIALQTDPRRLLSSGNNPMIDCSIKKTFETVEQLLFWVTQHEENFSIAQLT